MLSYCKVHGFFTAPTDNCPKCADDSKLDVSEDWFGVAGQDLARYRDFSAYVSLRVKDGVAKVKRLFVWPHTRYEVVMLETKRFCELDRVRVLDVDQGSAGIKIVEDYQGMNLPVEGVNFTAISKEAMVEYYRDVGRKGLLKLPKSGPFVSQLVQEIAEQERIQGASETPKFDHPTGTHDDLFWSLMLATRAAAPWLTEQRFGYMTTFTPRMAGVSTHESGYGP